VVGGKDKQRGNEASKTGFIGDRLVVETLLTKREKVKDRAQGQHCGKRKPGTHH